MTKKHKTTGQVIFGRLGITTLIAIYLLILAGGIVRSTGSGMGCPDWPKCFGQWVPPTEADQLPSNYKEIYAQQRKEKNAKLQTYLSFLGFHELSDRMQNDASMYVEADFNAYKTWIEYLNRLLGVVVGFLILFLLLASFAYWKTDALIPRLAFLTLVLVGFQGWIGSIVVSTNLLPGMITLHMSLAVLIVFCVIYMLHRVYRDQMRKPTIRTNKKMLNVSLLAILLISMIQVLMGTQVREAIDQVAKVLGGGSRGQWIEELGLTFYIHRSFSLLILGAHTFFLHKLWQNTSSKNTILSKSFLILLGMVLAEIISGASMAYLGMPAFLQPIHLLLAVAMLGIQFFLLLHINFAETTKPTSKILEKALEV